jgi:hypothetical protein
MEYAFSTVLGGMPVYATGCTYEDTIRLLTTCPACSSAVHLRMHSHRTYQKSGKTVLVKPYFAHYKAGNANDMACEIRCKSAAARQVLADRVAQFKGQRLEWYNKRLFDVPRAQMNLTPKVMTEVVRALGATQIRLHAKEYRRSYPKFRDSLFQCIDDQLDSELTEIPCPEGITRKQAIKDFIGASTVLHANICKEIMDFLATPSGGYALEKMIPAGFYLNNILRGSKGPFYSKEQWAAVDPTSTSSLVCSMVLSVRWCRSFYPELG